MLPGGVSGCLIVRMPRRVKQSRSRLAPLAESFVRNLSNADARLRRKIVRYGFWAIGLLFLYSLMVGNYGLPRIVRLELEKSALIEANRRAMVDLIDNDRIRKMLTGDRLYLEYIARTRYHMVKSNETIYYYRGR